MAASRQALKRAAQSGIRLAHCLFMRRPLETRLALCFHQLEPEHWDEFRACILYFKERGYRAVSASDFVAAQSEDRCLFISFDDSFLSWHQALAMLRSLDVTATFYVNTLPLRDVAKPTDIERYRRRLRVTTHVQPLACEELREIRAAGHRIGCHSHSHYILSRLPRDMWSEEILGSKQMLETILGEPVDDFSWPYGMRRHFSAELRRYCASIGFKTIANDMSGCQRIAGRDPLNVFRTDWRFGASLRHNLANLQIDGQSYASLTGGSVIG